MDRISQPDSQRAFFGLLGLCLAAIAAKTLFLAPLPEFGGDAAQKWFLAKDLAQGSLDVFRAQDVINHHYLRWGTWVLPVALISGFGDTVVLYFLSTALPAALAAGIFLQVFYRQFGFIVAALIAVIWFFDPQINRASFQLLPTGASLLPLALMVWMIQRFLEGRLSDRALMLWMAALLFWLYGAKETNIFFAPGVFFAVWALLGMRFAFGLTAICLGLYAIEAVILSAMVGEALWGGRLLALVSGDAKHLAGMLEQQHLIAEQEALWDAGILSRWYSVFYIHIPIYIPSILAFGGVILAYLRKRPEEPTAWLAFALSLIALSFVLLTSFFILSLDPVRLGQPIRSRYIAILLPLSAFILIFVIRQIAIRRVLGTIGLLGLVALVMGGALYGLTDRTYRSAALLEIYNGLNFKYAPRQSLSGWATHYETFGKELPAVYCDLEELDFKRLYFGVMYVPTQEGAADRLARLIECPQAAKFR